MPVTRLLILTVNALCWTAALAGTSNGVTCRDDIVLNNQGSTVVAVDSVHALVEAIDRANKDGDTTILLADGTYLLPHTLVIRGPRIAVIGESSDRDRVTIKGRGYTGDVNSVFQVNAPDFTLAHVSVGSVRNHGLQINGGAGADRPFIHDVRIFDTGEQLLKVTAGKPPIPSIGGVVQWSVFEFTTGIAPQWYTGGIDAHGAENWIVRHNTFRGIRSPEARLAEHAIHFWSNSRGTIVDGNTVTNSDRGIGFGLGQSGHHGGLIINNMVHTVRDVGIGLENARDAMVYNNTVFTEHYPNAIEYRFDGTTADIQGNLVNAMIRERDGGHATLRLNVTHARSEWFQDAANGDLHLLGAPRSVFDQIPTPPDALTHDMDCETRPNGAGAEIGADEL